MKNAENIVTFSADTVIY